MCCKSKLNKGHSRQCPSLKCVKSITCFCFTCVNRLYLFCSLLFQRQTSETGFSPVADTEYVFPTVVNQDTYRSFIRWHFSFSFLCVCFEDAIFWTGVDWRSPPPTPLPLYPVVFLHLSQCTLLSGPQTSRYNSNPSSPLPFLGFKVAKKSKERMQTGNGRLALGLLQRGIKNQCYLSLIYFKAKTVYWVQKQYFFFLPTQNTVATSTVPPQRNHGCCSNPRVVYISLIVIYVCLHLSQMMIA